MTGLAVEDVRVRYGGNTAVDGVSIAAPQGRITGLIGPNGAGKTTTFNACSGLVRPASGRVLFDGADVTAVSPPARARAGLGRTFQRPQLFESLSVLENVALGYEAARAGSRPLRHLVASRSDRADAIGRARDALARCGISGLGGRLAGSLSTGERRLVELARVLAGEFTVLLLDEPSAGLDEAETDAFGAVLSEAVATMGVGILLVEHDMRLVMGVCAHVYVLDFGKLLFEGSPAEVQASDVVRGAYLGEDVA